MEEQAPVCIVCGVVYQSSIHAQADPLESAQLAPELFASRRSSEEANLTGIGGWIILPAIGLAFSPFLNLHASIRDIQVLIGVRTGEALSTHMSLHLLVIFEFLTNSAFFLYTILLNVLLYTKRKALPAAMVIFLVANLKGSSIDFIALEQMHFHPQPSDLLRALFGAAIWVPYFLRSRRVALTFVR